MLDFNTVRYEGKIYRPPSEANSYDLTRVEAWGYPGGCGGGGQQLERTVTGRTFSRPYGLLMCRSRTTVRQRYTNPSAERAALRGTAKVPSDAARSRIAGGR